MRRSPAGLKLLKAENVFEIVWEPAGPASRYGIRDLRCDCRCAACVDEFTGAKLLDPAAVPADVSVRAVAKVGNYALKFSFTDGHDTGLFTWDHLYGLEPMR